MTRPAFEPQASEVDGFYNRPSGHILTREGKRIIEKGKECNTTPNTQARRLQDERCDSNLSNCRLGQDSTPRRMGTTVKVPVVFLSCPLVKKHADLSGSFLYSQSTMKNMYSKPTNRTKLSIPMKTKSIA